MSCAPEPEQPVAPEQPVEEQPVQGEVEGAEGTGGPIWWDHNGVTMYKVDNTTEDEYVPSTGEDGRLHDELRTDIMALNDNIADLDEFVGGLAARSKALHLQVEVAVHFVIKEVDKKEHEDLVNVDW